VSFGQRLAVAVVGRVHGRLGAWEFEDQPAVAYVHVGIAEHIAKEGAIKLRLVAVEKKVSAENHDRSLAGGIRVCEEDGFGHDMAAPSGQNVSKNRAGMARKSAYSQ